MVKGDVARELYFLIHGNAHVCLHTGSCSVAVGQTKDGDEKAALLRTESAVSDALHWIVPQVPPAASIPLGQTARAHPRQRPPAAVPTSEPFLTKPGSHLCHPLDHLLITPCSTVVIPLSIS